jgi:hypothetical protein
MVDTIHTEPRVFMRHMRSAKLCARGTRQWFERHGFSWEDFLRDGIPATDLESTGDPLALRPATLARQELTNGRR